MQENNPAMLPKIYTVQQVADYLDVSFRTVQKQIRQGRLGAIKVGREYRVPETALRDYLEAACQSTKNNSESADTDSSGTVIDGTSTGTIPAQNQLDAHRRAQAILRPRNAHSRNTR